MAVFSKALKIAIFPFRAIWFALLAVNFLIVAFVCLMMAGFFAYGTSMVFSYAFLPSEWTQALWRPAADLYAASGWFRAAVIATFTIGCLPILGFWPGRPSAAEADRERQINRLNDDLIAARQQDELRARLKA